ncbi:MAG: hypothetical protein DMG99_04310 [Acidobacteria bacterium]|nr:MAG: hypothetical protein DMG99_04310 [Acidobacteriota bacterium]
MRAGLRRKQHAAVHPCTAIGFAETGASVGFDFLVAAASNSRVRFLRAMFCLRSRWNLDLSPFTADILDSFDRVSEFLTERATAGTVARASFADCAARQSLQQNPALAFGEAYYAEVVCMWSPE